MSLFIVMSRVPTLSSALQASYEAAIPMQSLADLANLMRWLMLLRHTERATKDNFANHLFPLLFHELYDGQPFISRRADTQEQVTNTARH